MNAEFHAFAVAALAGIAINAAAFELSDPRIRVDEQTDIAWLNEDEILFQGFTLKALQEMRRGDISANYRATRILYIANVTSGEVREHVRLDRNGGFCYSAGRISYKKEGGNLWFGEFGAEKEAGGASKTVAGDAFAERLRCQDIDRSRYPQWPSELVVLLEEHGVIELRYADHARQYLGVYLWKPGAVEPVFVTDKRLSGLYYAPFKRAYFWGRPGYLDRTPTEGLWLYPDGRVETLVIPPGRWNEFRSTNATFLPTKVGMLVLIGGPDHVTYLLPPDRSRPNNFRSEEMRTVFRGVAWRFAVSPNGCRLAVATGAKRIPNTDPSHLEVIDLCTAYR